MLFQSGCGVLCFHEEEQASSLGRRLLQASAIPFAKRACPFANSWKAIPISFVFCSWNRTISSFISFTIVSNLLVASSLSAFSCIYKTNISKTNKITWANNTSIGCQHQTNHFIITLSFWQFFWSGNPVSVSANIKVCIITEHKTENLILDNVSLMSMDWKGGWFTTFLFQTLLMWTENLRDHFDLIHRKR